MSNYQTSIIKRYRLELLFKEYELIPTRDQEISRINDFNIHHDWTEVGIDGERPEFFDRAKHTKHSIRNKILEVVNYFYIEHANGVKQMWVRKGTNYILVASNNL